MIQGEAVTREGKNTTMYILVFAPWYTPGIHTQTLPERKYHKVDLLADLSAPFYVDMTKLSSKKERTLYL